MPQKRPQIKAGIKASVTDPSVLELFFLDSLYDTKELDWWTGEVKDTNMVSDIVAQIKAVNPARIMMTIDCLGGDAGIGLALYNFLSNYSAKVEGDVIGMCGSAATLLLMAASKGKRRMARNAFLIIHEAWGEVTGRADDLRKQADVVDKYTDQYCDIYSLVNTAGKSAEEIRGLLAGGDYWMTGQEAVEMGFADSIYNNEPALPVMARVGTLSADTYRNIPKNLISANVEQEESESTELPNALNSLIMDFKTKVNAFIDGFKKQPVNANAKNMAEEVANVMSEPMTQLVGALQTEVEEELKAFEPKISASLETKISAAVEAKFEERLKAIETVNANLVKENGDLKLEIADKLAGESGGGSGKAGSGANAAVTPIGKGIKAPAAA